MFQQIRHLMRDLLNILAVLNDVARLDLKSLKGPAFTRDKNRAPLFKRVENAHAKRIMPRIHHKKTAFVKRLKKCLVVDMAKHALFADIIRERIGQKPTIIIFAAINPKTKVGSTLEKKRGSSSNNIVALYLSSTPAHYHSWAYTTIICNPLRKMVNTQSYTLDSPHEFRLKTKNEILLKH